MRDRHAHGAAALLIGLSSISVPASASLPAALSDGSANVASRLRYEHADQDGAGRDPGQALTWRLRLGYQTAIWNNWSGLAEFEGVWPVSDDQDYNSLRNGASDRGVIADPQGEELNRLWLRYSGLPDTAITLGRQRIIFDNARFVGNVGWRQNEQSFRAASLVNSSLPDTRLNYAYIDRAETILFTSRALQGHLLNLHYAGLGKTLKLSAYAYLLDFEAGTNDSRTLGLRASGQTGKLSYSIEFAEQSAYRDRAAAAPDASYLLAEFGVDLAPLSLGLGIEILGGDDDASTAPFSTPLATLHKFQGWADLFLNTPDAGIQDSWLRLAVRAAGIEWLAVYHRFRPAAGGGDYGAEVDLLARRKFGKQLSGLVKYADYQADAFGVDTRRLWLQADYAF